MICHIFIMQATKVTNLIVMLMVYHIFIMQATKSDKFDNYANDLSYFHNASYEK